MGHTTRRGLFAATSAVALGSVLAFAGSTGAGGTPGGELSFEGQLLDSQGEWVADFQLWAEESPWEAPEYFPNGYFDEELQEGVWTTEGTLDLEVVEGDFDAPPSLQLSPIYSPPWDPGQDPFGIVCLGWIEQDHYDVNFWYKVDPDQELTARLIFFQAPENPCDTPSYIDDGVPGVTLSETEWTPDGFSADVPVGVNSLALQFDSWTTADDVYLDNISVAGPGSQGRAGVGNMFFSINADALSACDTNGPGAEPGFGGILGSINCGGSGGQAVSIDRCTAELETHGFVHADAPNTTFLGQVVIDIQVDVTNKNGALGGVRVDIYTPKDVITLSGTMMADSADGWMDTCDRLPGPLPEEE